MEFWHK